MSDSASVTLRPYGEADAGLLRALLGDPVAMAYLGGPEEETQLAARHARYLGLDLAAIWIFVIESGGCSVGWIGYWRADPDECEVGWHVLREAQGRGIATTALGLLIEHARAGSGCRFLSAFPSVDNLPSNALCHSAGFSELGEVDVEYPKGRLMRANHWRLDLAAGRSG